MSGPTRSGGFEPNTSPAERRDFFDLRRLIRDLQRQITELEARVLALETP